jgi:aryl-alcohol dehydrogenase-like predicted oxidoreductase
VTGGNISGYGGHANKIPARLCFENTTVDSAYGNGIRLFNAAACYGSGSGQTVPAPTAPSNLRIVK